MGEMKFTLPPDLSLDESRELELACVAGGPDGMPFLSQAHVDPSLLTVSRELDESGSLCAPWVVKKAGRLMLHTATLIERDAPYNLLLELARGKVNQLRNQAADWLMNGLSMPPGLAQQIKDATLAFCRAVARHPGEDSRQLAESALILGCEAADELVRIYTNQVFQVRQQRQPRLESVLGCRVPSTVPGAEQAGSLLKTFNGLNVPLGLADVASGEDDFNWEAADQLVRWSREQNVTVWGGPLLEFSHGRLPSWLWLWERDRGRLAKVLCDYTAEVVDRYRDQIRTWELTSAGNVPGLLSLQEDELVWLTLQMGEAARRVSSEAELVVGISQPWGEYMAATERAYSPFVYVDTLLRTNLPLAAINLEIVMGFSPRGSYCRDLLDLSRLLDLYALLGVPLHVTLAYPAGNDEDDQADSGVSQQAGYWRDGFTPQTQADWAAEFTALALCKPFVRLVQWAHASDADPHALPNGGLFAANGQPRPALARLRKLREKYLR